MLNSICNLTFHWLFAHKELVFKKISPLARHSLRFSSHVLVVCGGKEDLKKCGIEESPDKACPPSEIIVFLGVLFNTLTMTVEVTQQRLTEIRILIEQWLKKQTATLKEIQSLLGKLNFVAACVRPSRMFVSRMLNCLKSIYHSPNFHHSIPYEVRKD